MAQAQDMSDGAPAKRSLGRRLVMPILLLVLSAAGLAGGMAIAMGPRTFVAWIQGEDLPQPDPAEDTAATAAPETGHGAPAAGHAAGGAEMTVTPFKEMIVNITSTTATGRRTTRFLKLNVALVYDAAAEGADNVEARKLYMRDSFQDYLRQLNEADLQGTFGMTTLKSELLRRARAVTGSDAPQELLVSDLIVQ